MQSEELICPMCGNKEFKDTNVRKDETGYPYEYQLVCSECNYAIGLYSYGSFELYDEES